MTKFSEKLETQAGQGFGSSKAQQPKSSKSSVPAVRVEAANALHQSLANEVQQFGQLAQNWQLAADSAAEQVADWMAGALSGRHFTDMVLAKVAERHEQEAIEAQVQQVEFNAPELPTAELFRRTYKARSLFGAVSPKQIKGK